MLNSTSAPKKGALASLPKAPSRWQVSDFVVQVVHQRAYVETLHVLRVSRGEGVHSLVLELNAFQYAFLDLFTRGFATEKILEKLQSSFPREVADPRISAIAGKFLQNLKSYGVISKVGEVTVAPNRPKQRPFWNRVLSNPLYVKIPISNPHKVLNIIEPFFSPFFSRIGVVVSLTAAILVILNFLTAQTKLDLDTSMYREVLSGYNWFWLLSILLVLKIPHEFGHAIALRRAGQKVYEMGFLFLVMSPCLYCDVSEMRLLTSKWKQMGVALAGIYVDILVTACAAMIYLAAPSGDIAMMARLVVFANLGYTMIINLIPLTRFDGHYALASFWGRLELGLDARNFLITKMRWLLLDEPRWTKEDAKSDWLLLALFGVLSYIYRAFLIVVITAGFYYFGTNYGLGSVFAIVTLGYMLGASHPLLAAIDKKTV